MGAGQPLVSPWVWQASDYAGLAITITVTFNNSTKALTGATVQRDTGCQYHTMVFDVPTSAQAKTLAAPADGAGPISYTARQMSKQNLNVIGDIIALQITAQP